MTAARKVKVSLTLSPDVVAAIDAAATTGGTRSSVAEAWLRRAARQQVERELERATIEYYESLSDAERAEDAAISRASARAARKLHIDGDRDRRRRS